MVSRACTAWTCPWTASLSTSAVKIASATPAKSSASSETTRLKRRTWTCAEERRAAGGRLARMSRSGSSRCPSRSAAQWTGRSMRCEGGRGGAHAGSGRSGSCRAAWSHLPAHNTSGFHTERSPGGWALHTGLAERSRSQRVPPPIRCSMPESSIVRCRPSRSETSGAQPSSSLARVMSGLRCWGRRSGSAS